jgi:hypothetical protein
MIDEPIFWSRCCEILKGLSIEHARALATVVRGESQSVPPMHLEHLLGLGLLRQQGTTIALTANGRVIAPWCKV